MHKVDLHARLLLLLLTFVITEATAREVSVSITSPSHGASMPERPTIEGKVADPQLHVWVVVHPMDLSDYWVQPPVTVRSDGSWKVSIYIGRPGAVDVGKRFEVRAFVGTRPELREGAVLHDWPEAEARSDVLELVRK